MRTRRIIVLAVASVAVLGGVIWWAAASRPADPVYAGHPVSDWVSNPDLYYLKYPAVMDSRALPYLLEAMRRRDGKLRTAWMDLWNDFPGWLRERVAEPRPAGSVRSVSCFFLMRLGATARPAIPEMTRLLREDDDYAVRESAARALGIIATAGDRPVVEALVAATKDTNEYVRKDVGVSLLHIDPEAAAKAGVTNVP